MWRGRHTYHSESEKHLENVAVSYPKFPSDYARYMAMAVANYTFSLGSDMRWVNDSNKTFTHPE